MAEFIPALTLYQPWASLVAEGFKPFEFRSWPAPGALRGKRIAIHAGARPVRRNEVAALVYELRTTGKVPFAGLDKTDAILTLLDRVLTSPGSMPLSSVLCLATLGEPIRNEELAARLGLPWINDSDRNEHSNWGWPLTDIQRLEPFVPARGSQGFWRWRRVVT
jgi:hypothetical protein